MNKISCVFEDELKRLKEYGTLPISDYICLMECKKKKKDILNIISKWQKSLIINHKNEKDVLKLSSLFLDDVETVSSMYLWTFISFCFSIYSCFVNINSI